MKLSWSHKLFLKINAHVGKRPWLDAFMKFSAKWLIFVMIVLTAVAEEWYRGIFSVALLGAMIFVGLIASWLIAWFWRHPRPIVEIPETKELITPLSHWKTFPSDHTLVAFIIAFFYLFSPPRWSLISVVVLIMACIVSVSRVYVGVHYPRDIVGGIVLALCLYIGLFVFIVYNFIYGGPLM